MSEYNVSPILAYDLSTLSGSAFELGDNAMGYTWQNCLEAADDFGDSIGLDYQDARDHFQAYGAWTEEEIAEWTERELQALVIQEAAASLRDMEDPDWNEEDDGGRLYVVRDEDGEPVEVYVYLGM